MKKLANIESFENLQRSNNTDAPVFNGFFKKLAATGLIGAGLYGGYNAIPDDVKPNIPVVREIYEATNVPVTPELLEFRANYADLNTEYTNFLEIRKSTNYGHGGIIKSWRYNNATRKLVDKMSGCMNELNTLQEEGKISNWEYIKAEFNIAKMLTRLKTEM